MIALIADLCEPLAPAELDRRVRLLSEHAPIISARRDGDWWVRGEPPVVTTSSDDAGSGLGARFALDLEPPLRLRLSDSHRTLVIEGHHAAFDGLGLATVVTALTSETPEVGRVPDEPVARPPTSERGSAAITVEGRTEGSDSSLWSRLLRPAPRVAASCPPPRHESFVAQDVAIDRGGAFTARLTRACVDAAIARNRSYDIRMSRVGISLGLGGSRTIGNTASYRRVDLDLRSKTDIAEVVRNAIADEREPAELRFAPSAARLLARPVASWFSDSLLVSNLGIVDAPGVRRLQFFPVARGRSAVAFGAASLARGRATLTLRARDLDRDDALQLLGMVSERLTSPGDA
ncbi:MAG TPA: hypothetical protein VGP92_08815 [Acidimicrobiia bacterium]|nr:hypothetical protein [Acidimicrobiia bacterium]